jgi:hypothetical protein
MTNCPVMFTFQDTVSGNGFLSGIEIHGRAIMTREDDGKWCGVVPLSETRS